LEGNTYVRACMSESISILRMLDRKKSENFNLTLVGRLDQKHSVINFSKNFNYFNFFSFSIFKRNILISECKYDLYFYLLLKAVVNNLQYCIINR
jgi:hypothetical protein